MGECDIVLLHAPDFDGHGFDLDIHIRTTIRYLYSFIESAAIRIHGEILEVGGYGSHALNNVDHVFAYSDSTAGFSIGGYPIYYTEVNEKAFKFDIVIGPNENVTLSSFKDLVAVHFDSGKSQNFFKTDVTGIMGSIVDGKLLSRDGITEMSADTNAFGKEWQVRDNEPKLFRTNRAPQYPDECVLPSPESMEDRRRRRLGESRADMEAAQEACGKHYHESSIDYDNCVYDVLAVGDLDIAEAGAF